MVKIHSFSIGFLENLEFKDLNVSVENDKYKIM